MPSLASRRRSARNRRKLAQDIEGRLYAYVRENPDGIGHAEWTIDTRTLPANVVLYYVPVGSAPAFIKLIADTFGKRVRAATSPEGPGIEILANSDLKANDTLRYKYVGSLITNGGIRYG